MHYYPQKVHYRPQKVHYRSQKVHYYPVQALCGADLTDPQEVQEASISLKNSIAVAIFAFVDNFCSRII